MTLAQTGAIPFISFVNHASLGGETRGAWMCDRSRLGLKIDMSGVASRYVASFFIELFSEFLRFGVHQNDLTVEEVAIICLVASESTRELRKDPFLTRTFANEEAAIPDEARPVVSLKFIYTSLGMSRETTRRRVNGLVARGYLRRQGRGFYFPAQTGDADYTFEIRGFLARKLKDLNSYLAKIPD